MRLFVLLLALSACHSSRPEQPGTTGPVDDLRAEHRAVLKELDEHRGPLAGWIAEQDCDSALHNAIAGAGGLAVNLTAAEYPVAGHWQRRPVTPCWTPEQGNQGSSTTWSRDMGLGLILWAWDATDRGALERHADYGVEHRWLMGEPVADLRALYNPAIIGELYQTIYALGGSDNANRLWPGIYPAGLVDFEARLQVLGIWHRGRVASRMKETDAMPAKPEGQALMLDISNVMFQRLEEHAAREPECPFYAAALAIYTGDYQRTFDLLLASHAPKCSYIRCDDLVACQLADWALSAKMILDHF